MEQALADWISAKAAMERLNIRPQTLYAYVSRGKIEARSLTDDPRQSLYRAADIAKLQVRKARGRKASTVAEDTIALGEPVLASSITSLNGGRLYYRGKDAAQLCQTETLETVAALLWANDHPPIPAPDLGPVPGPDGKTRAFAALARAAATGAPMRGRHMDLLQAEAGQVLHGLADAVAGPGAGSGPIHQRLATAWGCDAAGAQLVRQALVLLADHELNASTFAARVAASTGASLAASALAGLCALSGPLHGGMVARVSVFMDEVERAGAAAAFTARLSRGANVPGFGHPLYPDGDPRAKALLAAITLPPEFAEVLSASDAALGTPPNIDFALAALATRLALPAEAPFLIFATARCAGWLAHALEQHQTGHLIRPRARYIGPGLEG
jgi:citrate synthase